MHITLKGTLSADVANGGTFVISLPTAQSGQNLADSQANFPVTGGDFHNASGHRLVLNGGEYTFPNNIGVAVAASTVTITNNSGVTWRAGASWVAQLQMKGFRYWQDNDPAFSRTLIEAVNTNLLLVNLGMPSALSANSIALAQAGVNGNLTLNGAIVGNGVANLDVPRNVSVVSANAGDTTQVLTVFGFDVYGQPLRENLTLTGTTTVNGNKAFARVTRVSCSAVTAGQLTVGHGNRLGLPVYLPSAGFILRELQDGATAAAGTTVAGARVASTATSVDVRGVYTPAVAPNGALTYELLIAAPDSGNTGAPQFNG